MSNDSSKTVPWNPWLAVLFVIFIFFASQIVAALLVSVYPVFKHWPAGQATDWLNNSTAAQFFFITLAETLTLGAIYVFLRLYKVGFGAIGLRRPRWSDVGYGVLAVVPYYFLYALVVGVVSYFVHGLNVDQQQQIGFNDVAGGAALVMTFLSLVILPPLTEEIMVRGLLYGSLKKALPVMQAAVVTSLVFAAAHLPEGGAAGPLYIAAIDTFVLSLVLIYLREKTGGLWAAITLHAIKNGIAFVALFLLHAR
jgi:membrane protease YdiL (CAAX protease family)